MKPKKYENKKPFRKLNGLFTQYEDENLAVWFFVFAQHFIRNIGNTLLHVLCRWQLYYRVINLIFTFRSWKAIRNNAAAVFSIFVYGYGAWAVSGVRAEACFAVAVAKAPAGVFVFRRICT